MAKFELGQNVIHASQTNSRRLLRTRISTANVMTIIGVGDMHSHNGMDTIYRVSFLGADGHVHRDYVDEQEIAKAIVTTEK